MMKEQELNNLLDKAIGTKGNLKVPSFWMRKIFKELIEWCKSQNNSQGCATNIKWSILQGSQERYLTFEALEDGIFSFTATGYGDSMWYSKNNSTWTELPSGELVSVAAGDKVMWKSTLMPTVYNSIGKFSSSNKFNISGNIMSLSYGDDFMGKTSLEYDRIYFNLFENCENLVDAKNLILPATTLTNVCYGAMFAGCSSLVTAPELPATTLAESCYFRMFECCKSLTTAPELPATTLAESCYEWMFNSCTNLNHITMLATNISAYRCLENWVDGVASTGIFTKHPDMISLPTGKSGIPEGWTVEDAVIS